MSRFYGKITGASGISSRRSTGKQGISAHISGWNKGIKVTGFVDDNGMDCFDIFETGGSNNPEKTTKLLTVTDDGAPYEKTRPKDNLAEGVGNTDLIQV